MAGESRRRGGLIQWVLGIGASLAFLGGYITSVVAGIWWPDHSSIIAALSVMGLVVGFLNITGREVLSYLVAAVALVLIGTTRPFTPLDDVVGGLGTNANDIVGLMAIFTAPAAVIQAVRAGIVLAGPGEYRSSEPDRR
jgi:hypothetical protein